MTKKADLNEVAEKSGFSKSTVSRALRNSSRISDATRQKVLAVARELNYQPNPVARALNYKEISVIMIVVPDCSTPYQAEVIEGCREALYRKGYNTLVMDNSLFNQRATGYLEVVKSQVCNGAIFFFENNDETMEKISVLQPVVSFEYSSQAPSVCSLVSNSSRAMQLALEHLKAHGHRRVGLVHGRPQEPYTRRFREAYATHCRVLGLEYNSLYLQGDNWGRENGYTATLSLLNLASPPSAILYMEAFSAQGGMMAAYDLGYRVPDDLSVMTMDGAAANRYYLPGIATVDYVPSEMGKMLAEMMYNQISGHAAEMQDREVQPRGVRTGGSVGYAKT